MRTENKALGLMASGTSLQHIFSENSLAEKPTLMQSLSLGRIRPVKTVDNSSLELFGELHYREGPRKSSSSPSLDTTASTTQEDLDFYDPYPESPTLLEALSLNKIRPPRPFDESSITEFFGELHFNDIPTPSSCSSTHGLHQEDVFDTQKSNHITRQDSGESFSSLSPESLHFCTESLGFESSDDVEDLKAEMDEYCWKTECDEVGTKEKTLASEDGYGECRRSRLRRVEFPPPIKCIGTTGKPWVYFKSYRENGRFVLKEISVPTREFLYANREDGRLKLHFILPSDECKEDQNVEGEEEEEDDDDDDDDDDDAESIDEKEKKDDDIAG